MNNHPPKTMRSAFRLNSLLFIATGILNLLPLHAAEQVAEPPKPAPPVSAPEPGMEWTISIRPAAEVDAKPIIIEGMRGPRNRVDTATFPDGSKQQWFTQGDTAYLQTAGSSRVTEIELRDDDPEAARSFYVSGFPGVSWVRPDSPFTQELDNESQRWLTIYEQTPGGYRTLGEGEDQIALPEGPSIPVKAFFDSETGLPLRAEVGDQLYTYAIALQGGVEPDLPEGFRSAMNALLKRQITLQNALQSLQSSSAESRP